MKPGDTNSGLLPFIKPPAGDSRETAIIACRRTIIVSAYDEQASRLLLKAPDDYDAAKFELLGRYLKLSLRREKAEA
jgi:hypothetical protein